MPRELKDLIWLDCETTGLAADRCRIIEIAAVVYDATTYRWKDQASFLVDPGEDDTSIWEPVARKMAGWPEDHEEGRKVWRSKGAVDIGTAINRIVPMFKGCTPAGQNPAFDMRFLLAAQTRLKRLDSEFGDETMDATGRKRVVARLVADWPEFDYHLLDLASMAWPLYVAGQIPGLSLKHTSKLFGVPDDQAHKAMRDVADSIHVYEGMMRLYEPVASMAASRAAEWASGR